MSDVKSTAIIPISFYCFVLGAYSLLLAAITFFSDHAYVSDIVLQVWVPTGFFILLAGTIINIGIGILKLDRTYWKVLFFMLAICISCMASFTLAFLGFLIVDIKFLTPYFKSIQTNSAGWFSFLGVFLSGIIVLYYLTHREVVASFGGMDEMVSPF